MGLRLLYLTFVRVAGWLVLLGRLKRAASPAEWLIVAEMLANRCRQAQQTIHIQGVDPAEVHQDVRFNPAVDPTIMGERDIPHNRPISVAAPGEPQVHDYRESRQSSSV
ncbi:hypothetical protein EJK15_64270 [Nonomuraea basaltis]|nr:hypothetical protein [Nonomuraea basaltis]TMR88791.1 hypothetical protein EJK15_64270 [Nonomuraea basaltis]